MTISSIPGSPVAFPASTTTSPAPIKPAAQPAPQAPAAVDSDGDYDGSSVNVKA